MLGALEVLFALEMQACMTRTHTYTRTHTPPRLPQSRYPTMAPSPIAVEGLPSPHEANPLRELPESNLREGRKVKSVHEHSFWLAQTPSGQREWGFW